MLRNALSLVAGVAAAAVCVWCLTSTGAFEPDGGGSRADLPFEFWLLAVTVGAFVGSVVVVVFRRR